MKRKLEMDDIRVGMYVTILKGEIEEKVIPGPVGPKVISREKKYYNGNVLEILALDLPYMVVMVHDRLRSRQDSIDLRRVEIMSLSPEYIQNLHPDFKFNEDSFWDEIKDTSIEDADTTIEEIFKDL